MGPCEQEGVPDGLGSAGVGRSPPSIDKARALALRVLAFHARSEAQLRDRLARAGHESCAGEVIAWLKRLGYVDDAAYARGRARSLLASGRAGPRLVERRLFAAGIPREDARRAVASALREVGSEGGSGAADELALCRAAAERKLRGARATELDDRGRARLARHLLGRGFSPEVVSRVLRMEDAD
ncbi:MAG TPA: regulatory protein RecX [Anaeromyxobacteraceae bacterium]|nr:regulatory protein RecX [Anaeromyxobacteraceae bacterium]